MLNDIFEQFLLKLKILHIPIASDQHMGFPVALIIQQ